MNHLTNCVKTFALFVTCINRSAKKKKKKKKKKKNKTTNQIEDLDQRTIVGMLLRLTHVVPGFITSQQVNTWFPVCFQEQKEAKSGVSCDASLPAEMN